VKKNAGAAGIDRMSIEDFDKRKDELFPIIYEKLQEGTYRFMMSTESTNPEREWRIQEIKYSQHYGSNSVLRV